MQHTARTIALAMAAVATVGLLAGCRGDRSEKPPREFIPNMDDSPAKGPQSKSTFFNEFAPDSHGGKGGEAWGRTSRDPVTGTVAFGRRSQIAAVAGVDFAQRDEFVRTDTVFHEGRVYDFDDAGMPILDEAGNHTYGYPEYIPSSVKVDAELIALGRDKYAIFCLPCHGGSGQGDGLVGTRWSYVMPNFHDERYFHGGERGADGYLFNVIKNGVPAIGTPWQYAMQPYGRKLDARETWAIVAYIRTVQMTRQGTVDMVGPEAREMLRNTRPPAPPAGSSAQDASEVQS